MTYIAGNNGHLAVGSDERSECDGKTANDHLSVHFDRLSADWNRVMSNDC
jgi:hypothetical protein